MAHQRTISTATASDPTKEPHPISLKVLRLSRPTLAEQHPLPDATTALSSLISPAASVSYPSSATNSNSFIITPLLTLPPAFGNAYVGETFSCTLCANNEIIPTSQLQSKDDTLSRSSSTITPNKHISNVRIDAEMKTPTMTVPLDVSFTDGQNPKAHEATSALSSPQALQQGHDVPPAASLQGIITFHLREEGSHVLAVTVSYNETGATSGRLRTFRKLYQFVARPCLVVRTKISNFSGREAGTPSRRWALEAQLENVGEDAIVLESVGLETKEWCAAKSLNWDAETAEKETLDGEETAILGGQGANPILNFGDVQQVCFLVERRISEEKVDVDVAGRLMMGMLNITWRGSMGNMGSLSTGWLGLKP